MQWQWPRRAGPVWKWAVAVEKELACGMGTVLEQRPATDGDVGRRRVVATKAVAWTRRQSLGLREWVAEGTEANGGCSNYGYTMWLNGWIAVNDALGG